MLGFENQLKTEHERMVFSVLEIRSRCSKTPEDIDKVFSSLLKDKPEAAGMAWFEPLRAAVVAFSTENSKEDEYLSIATYIRSIERKYMGYPVLFGVREPKGLSEFSEEELSAPHMQWVKELDRKYHMYLEKFPSLSKAGGLTLARYSTLSHLSDYELLTLHTNFKSNDCDYNTCMSFADWVEWYENSKSKFDEKGTPAPELAESLQKNREAWKEQSQEEIEYWLCRNYEIHPYHENLITSWCAETL